VKRGERTIKMLAAALILCTSVALVGWGVGKGVAEEEQATATVGLYQAAAPDLVLDTATGKLVDSQGQVLEQPVDQAGTEAGRYSAAGYVSAVTRSVGLDVINQPIARSELVKGYIIVDTQTGQVVRQRVYYRQPLQPTDL
jgi:hypothetical protein